MPPQLRTPSTVTAYNAVLTNQDAIVPPSAIPESTISLTAGYNYFKEVVSQSPAGKTIVDSLEKLATYKTIKEINRIAWGANLGPLKHLAGPVKEYTTKINLLIINFGFAKETVKNLQKISPLKIEEQLIKIAPKEWESKIRAVPWDAIVFLIAGFATISVISSPYQVYALYQILLPCMGILTDLYVYSIKYIKEAKRRKTGQESRGTLPSVEELDKIVTFFKHFERLGKIVAAGAISAYVPGVSKESLTSSIELLTFVLGNINRVSLVGKAYQALPSLTSIYTPVSSSLSSLYSMTYNSFSRLYSFGLFTTLYSYMPAMPSLSSMYSYWWGTSQAPTQTEEPG